MSEVGDTEQTKEILTKEVALQKVIDHELNYYSTVLGDGRSSLGKAVLEGQDAEHLANLSPSLMLTREDNKTGRSEYLAAANMFKQEDIVQLVGGEENFNKMCEDAYTQYRKAGEFEPHSAVSLNEDDSVKLYFSVNHEWDNNLKGFRYWAGVTNVSMPLTGKDNINGYDLVNKGLDNWRNAIKNKPVQQTTT